VKRQASTFPLLTATKENLLARLDADAAAISTLTATVDLSPTVGGPKKGKETEYTDIRGYILVRKPTMLRMIGLLPVVRNRAFDMVSNGVNFWLSIPPKNKFIFGRNDLIYPQQQGLEALRPQAIFDALLLRPVDLQSEIAVLQSGTERVTDPKTHKQVDEPDYILIVIRKESAGSDYILARKIYFSREDLLPTRQVIYDKLGQVVTDAHYEKYTNSEGVQFPGTIQIDRPQEEYSILLSFLKVRFNTPITDEQFALNQPPGSQLVRMDEPPRQQSAVPQVKDKNAPQPNDDDDRQPKEQP
jgi:outer membrane lipoprotein-sorting protein